MQGLISNLEISSSGDYTSSSSDDEGPVDNNATSVFNDPTLMRIRSLIKRVRELIGVVHQSGPLSEYIRTQANEKKLHGEVGSSKESTTSFLCESSIC